MGKVVYFPEFSPLFPRICFVRSFASLLFPFPGYLEPLISTRLIAMFLNDLLNTRTERACLNGVFAKKPKLVTLTKTIKVCLTCSHSGFEQVNT